jgi:hypothetical protein
MVHQGENPGNSAQKFGTGVEKLPLSRAAEQMFEALTAMWSLCPHSALWLRVKEIRTEHKEMTQT